VEVAPLALLQEGLAAQPHVVELRWPADEGMREELAAQGHARLFRVADGEIEQRKGLLRRRLAARHPVWMDDHGLLRRGAAWVALAPLEVRVLETLLERRGELVSRPVLRAALYEDPATRDPRLIDATVRRLRRRVCSLGVTIHTVRATGFLLEVGDPPA
jgi:DNA-binding response OmpR family regulator